VTAAIAGETIPVRQKVCRQKRARGKPQAAGGEKQQQQKYTHEMWARGKRKSSGWQRRLFHGRSDPDSHAPTQSIVGRISAYDGEENPFREIPETSRRCNVRKRKEWTRGDWRSNSYPRAEVPGRSVQFQPDEKAPMNGARPAGN
jgi:hypothetical protein